MNNKKIFGLYGAGGHGQESILMDTVLDKDEYDIFLIDDKLKYNYFKDIEIITLEKFLKIKNREKYFNISISDHKYRQDIAEHMIKNNVEPLSLISSNSINYQKNGIGIGLLQSPYSIISCNVKIGNFFHLNSFSSIHHDCVIGNYVTISTGVRCNGNIEIGNNVFIGSGAVIRNGSPEKPIRIGHDVVIGMGSVVTKDIPSYAKVYGNPATPKN